MFWADIKVENSVTFNRPSFSSYFVSPSPWKQKLCFWIRKHWKPFVPACDAWSCSKIFCLFARNTGPSSLWKTLNKMQSWPACSGAGMTIAWWRGLKKLFSGFCFYLLWLSFSCFDMMAKMCTAFLCHPQTYFQHACFHEEREGSISLAQLWERGVYMETICSTDTLLKLTCSGRGGICEIRMRALWGVNLLNNSGNGLGVHACCWLKSSLHFAPTSGTHGFINICLLSYYYA